MGREQLEADVTAIKNDKMQVQNLMTQVKVMHEEDSKRFAEDLARVNRDCERKVAYIYVWIYVCIYVCKYVCMYPCIHVCTRIHM